MKNLPLITYHLSLIFAAAQSLPPRPAVEQSHLQGHWEGDGAGGKCSITITNNTLLYRVGTNWHKTTFTLPTGTNPQQLHATIIDVFPHDKNSIGQVVPAIIKIEQDTLTLAAYSLSQDPPKTFEEATTKYVVTKVQPQKVEAVKPKAN
jgi:hypothetical protein